MLTLPESLLLLALDDEGGAVNPSCSIALPHGLAAGVLLELSGRKRISLQEKGVRVLSTERTEDDILDAALAQLGYYAKPHKAAYWVARPDYLVENLKGRLLDRFLERRILRRENRQYLWFFNQEQFPEQNPLPERELRSRLLGVAARGHEADERTLLLLSLVYACGLEREAFPGQDPAAMRQRLKLLAASSRLAQTVKQQVDTMTSAILASTLTLSMALMAAE